MSQLQWTYTNGVHQSEELGASYQVWDDSSTGMRTTFWSVVFGGIRQEGLSRDEVRAKHKCQSHHDAICTEIKKGILKTIKLFGSNMTEEQILSLPE